MSDTQNLKRPKNDPFETSKFSVAWAKDHIVEFDREAKAFLNDDNSCALITEPDADGIYNLLKFKFREAMPRPIRGHASDAAINLKNALDQSVYAASGRFNYFPIRDTKEQFDGAMTDVGKRGHNDICDLIRGAKPYKSGNSLLWALNKLANTNKHGILRPVMPSNRLIEVSGFGLGIQVFQKPLWDGDKNEMVLARIPLHNMTDPKFNINYQAAFFVAFNEIEFIDGKEAVGILDNMAAVVKGIVMAIEAESKRIGLI